MINMEFTKDDNEAVEWCEKNHDGTIYYVL